MKKQQGFTLIELVIVIIILGILAVTAAPKFINLQSDARVSALQGVKGAVQSANSLVYSKAAIQGKQNSDQEIEVDIGNGNKVPTKFGYIVGTSAAVKAATQLDDKDWSIQSSGGTVTISQADKNDAGTCVFEYIAPSSSTALPQYKTPVEKDC